MLGVVAKDAGNPGNKHKIKKDICAFNNSSYFSSSFATQSLMIIVDGEKG